MHRATAYTDGSARGNPGPAGWAVVMDGRLSSGWVDCATNNEMEIYAILQAVLICEVDTHLFIYTDSKLCIGWLSQSMGMRKRQIIAIAKAYFMTIKDKNIVVTFKHVKGHEANEFNILADNAARAQSKKAKSAVLSRTKENG